MGRQVSKEHHVIKGRGENRGKYLCWARMAPDTKPTEDGFVWLSEQREAVRWDDPQYNRHTWATARALLHDGYFVKLIVPKAITARVPELKAYIYSHAAGADEPLRGYWFGGDFHDASENFCRDCAEKFVDQKYAEDPDDFEKLYPDCEDADERYEAAIDGGFETDHDSPPRCKGCGAKLFGHLTDYGASEELGALTGDCAPAFNDREGWGALERAIMNLRDDDPRWRKIAKLVDTTKLAEAEAEQSAAELAASTGMVDARGELLAILHARAVQKTIEPSFRLWPELLAWHRRPLAERNADPEARALEKRMIAEAKRFASCLGLASHWSGGLFLIGSKGGGYHWPFVVKAEQYRLWNPPAFQEGRAHALNPPKRDKRYRDANPYAKEDGRSEQWDAGYLHALYSSEAV